MNGGKFHYCWMINESTCNAFNDQMYGPSIDGTTTRLKSCLKRRMPWYNRQALDNSTSKTRGHRSELSCARLDCMMIKNTVGGATTSETVHVVDDDSNTRAALFQLLTIAGYRVKLHASAAEFLKAYDGLPSCLILDLAMPKMRGEVLLDNIVQLKLNVVVLIMTGHATIEAAIRVTRAGALGLLQKPFNSVELLKTVEDIFHKARPVFARRALADDYRQHLSSLTAREREVFDLMVAGMTSQEIAALLGNSKKTIDIHRARVMQKMGARAISELIMGWTLLFRDHSPEHY